MNRVLTKSGKTDENKAFVQTAKACLKKQVELVKEHCKTGVEFTGTLDIGDAPASAPAPAPAAEPKKEAAPAPEKKAEVNKPAPEKKSGDLFKELGQGLAITGGLKKVEK